MPKFKKNKKIRYDLTLPGYNYLGPFNDLNKGKPTTESDAAALRHDTSKDYQDPWAYLYYNDADEDLLKDLKGKSDYGAKLASIYFTWKKHTMPRLKKKNDVYYTKKRPNSQSPEDPERKRLRGPYSDIDSNPIVNVHDRRGGTLIPEKDMESAGTSEDVEVATDLMAMRSGGGGGGASAVAHETEVTIPRSITYGFPDTWTCVLPLNLSFQIICEGPKRPAMLSVRMNSIYDCIANGASSVYSGTVSASSTFGSLIGTTATNATTNDSYINSNTGKSNLTTGNQQPAWRPFFEAHYDKYHVMGCEWELSTRLSFPESNAHRIRGALATMYHGKEIPPVDGITLADMLYWKNLDQVDYVLPESAVTPMGSVATHIQGRYRPGQHKREVREDAEAKTWTDTGANPTLQENLAIYFCEAPLSWTPLADDIANASLSYQCFLTLKYIVQWKDLKLAWQYPTSATNTEFATHL